MTKKATKNDAKDKKAKDGKTFLAHVLVTLKPTVNDPEGNTIAGALTSLGFEDVAGVRAGRYFQVRLAAKDRKTAGSAIDQMCARLLANPVIETYSYEVTGTK